MSRRFDGTDDLITWSLGTCTVSSAFTMVCCIKLDTGVTWQAFNSVEHSTGGAKYAIGRSSLSGQLACYKDGGAGGTSDALSISNSDGWMVVAVAKAAGTGAPTHYKYPIGGTISSGAGDSLTDQAAAVNRYIFGGIAGSDDFDGWLWAAAHWNSALSQANIESLVDTFTQANWLSLSPAAMWDDTDAFATDLTGNGADQLSIAGTTDDADDPAGADTWTGEAAAPIVPYRPRRMPLGV